MILTPEKLEDYLKDSQEWRILIDTCSLWSICTHGNDFWHTVTPILQKLKRRIIIPLQCLLELKSYADGTNAKATPEKSQIAASVGVKIHQLLQLGVVEIIGEAVDGTFADKVFLMVIQRFKAKYNFLVITQDSKLAGDIATIDEQKSFLSDKRIIVAKYSPKDFLCIHFEQYTGMRRGKEQFKRSKTLPPEHFFKTQKVTDIKDSTVSVSSVPAEGDTAYRLGNRKFRLVKTLASGGEGHIYTTNTEYVAKIYKRENMTTRRLKKIELLLKNPLNYPGICAPTEPVFNASNQIVGYLMPKAKGKELQKCVFVRPLLEKYFPRWKKKDTVKLCLTILDKIHYLHSRGIIMGDINPLNIMVVSPDEVYFVDTDSYQMDCFPCPVGTINYTAPEIQGKNFADFLRTPDHENYAIATLLFMIMLPGRAPYSQLGGGTPGENIRRMDFSYPLGDNSNKKTPDGLWRFIWSHMTYAVKDAFYHTFHRDGRYARGGRRLGVNEWMTLFHKYHELLVSGKLGENDKKSELLFPDTFKGQSKRDGVPCVKCGSLVVSSNARQKKRVLCRTCAQLAKEIAMRITCCECKQPFTMSKGEKDFFDEKGMQYPKRCPNCRKNKKSDEGGLWGFIKDLCRDLF